MTFYLWKMMWMHLQKVISTKIFKMSRIHNNGKYRDYCTVKSRRVQFGTHTWCRLTLCQHGVLISVQWVNKEFYEFRTSGQILCLDRRLVHKLKNFTVEKWINIFFFYNIYLSPGLREGCPSYSRSLQHSKENIQHFQHNIFRHCLLFLCLISAILGGSKLIRIQNTG